VAASLFALQTDDRENSFIITRGEAFYMQVKYNGATKYIIQFFALLVFLHRNLFLLNLFFK